MIFRSRLNSDLSVRYVFLLNLLVVKLSRAMPCAECGRFLDWWEISWHHCQNDCVDDTTWIADLCSGQRVQCSRGRCGSYWFFYCRPCKDARVIGHFLTGVRIRRIGPLVGYRTDSENMSDSDRRDTSQSLSPSRRPAKKRRRPAKRRRCQ